jgi:hypothetical protein
MDLSISGHDSLWLIRKQAIYHDDIFPVSEGLCAAHLEASQRQVL